MRRMLSGTFSQKNVSKRVENELMELEKIIDRVENAVRSKRIAESPWQLDWEKLDKTGKAEGESGRDFTQAV